MQGYQSMQEAQERDEQLPKKEKGADKQRDRRDEKEKGGGTRRDWRDDGRKKNPFGHIDAAFRYREAQAHRSAERAKKSERFTQNARLMQTETAGGLEPENELDRTLYLRQSQIRPNVDLSTSSKLSFRLDLPSSNLSPYTTAAYSRSGRSLLVASRKGHVSMMNWRNATLQCELHLNETIRSATFLHNDAFFATAQKQHAFIYDTSGAQVHALRQHREPGTILSLPHHLLLASVSAPNTPRSHIVYTDTSTGEIVANHDFSSRKLALSAAANATVNMSNGLLNLAHNSGVVSMWAPNTSRPLARVFCHAGGVRHVGVTGSGSVMVTAGGDGVVKVTDLRTYKPIQSFRVPKIPTALAISQRDVIALSFGATVQLWAMARSALYSTARLKTGEPYMTETFSGKRVTGLDFCPFEDVLAVCHEDGMFSMLVPGSGEPTFDSAAPNPYETRKQRRENEVRSLLDKLPAETITLEAGFVASVDADPEERLNEMKKREVDANIAQKRGKRMKNKMKGRNKISKVVKRRQNNIIEARRLEMQDEVNQGQKTRLLAAEIKAQDERAVAAGTLEGRVEHSDLPDALSRFLPRK